MLYSTIGITGVDLLFSTEEKDTFREVLYLFSSKEIKALLLELANNKKSIEDLNLKVDITTQEYKDLCEEVDEFLTRFVLKRIKNEPKENDLTSEFSDLDDLFSDVLDDFAKDNEKLYEFFVIKSWQKDLKSTVDKKILQNRYAFLEEAYNKLPRDLTPLLSYDIKNKYTLNVIQELSKNIYKTDDIISFIYKYKDSVSSVLDIPINGRYDVFDYRVGVFKKISKTYRRKSDKIIDECLRILSRYINNYGEPDSQQKLDEDISQDLLDDIEMYMNEYVDKSKVSASNLIMSNHKIMTVLNKFYKVIKTFKSEEKRLFFNNKDLNITELCDCSIELCSKFGITGLLPNHEEILIRNYMYLNKPENKTTSVTERDIKVFKLIGMSLVSERYNFVRGD